MSDQPANGSRWFVPLFEGFIDAKHVERLGNAVWLFLYMLKYAYLHEGGEFDYTHIDASRELGVPRNTIRRWFTTLQKHRMILSGSRTQYGMKVRVLKWRPVEEFRASVGRSTLAKKAEREGDKDSPEVLFRVLKNGHPDRDVDFRVLTRVLTRVFKNEHPLYIRITKALKDLSIPNANAFGADGAEIGEGDEDYVFPFDSLSSLSRHLCEWVESTPNKPAAVKAVFELCYGARDAPDYGRIGKSARRAGGYGRLAELIWQSAARPPTGDVLSYIDATVKVKANAKTGKSITHSNGAGGDGTGGDYDPDALFAGRGSRAA